MKWLTDYLATVTAHTDEMTAMVGGLEHVVVALEAEIGAIVGPDGVMFSWGMRSAEVSVEELTAAATRRIDAIGVPGVGACKANVVEFQAEPPLSLVVARSGETFSNDELILMDGMAKVLALVLDHIGFVDDQRAALYAERRLRESGERQMAENARLLAMVRERQVLLEKLSRIQRSISTHAPLHEVFATIVEGARELLDDQVIGLRLLDHDNHDFVVMVASLGMSDSTLEIVKRQPRATGLGGRAMSEGRLVVSTEYSVENGGLDVFVAEGVRMAMSAPIHDGGKIVGSLTVGSTRERQPYSDAEQDFLLAFAEHASLALTDARTLAAMHAAMHDSLTGLPSRALFFDRLEHSFASMGRTGIPTGVLFMDIDRFKSVNDRLGHAAGDGLLAQTASRLLGCLRESDTAARLGGDEFAVIVEQVLDIETMVATAERIVRAMAEPFFVSGAEVSTTVSVGVALNSPGLSDSETLLRHADLAMYGAKHRGGDCLVVFDPSMVGRGQLS